MAACDLDGAAAQDTVRLLGSPGSEDGAPRGKHAAFQADVSQGPAARRLLEQVQVNRTPRRATPRHATPHTPQPGPLWSLVLASPSLT